MKHAIIHIGVHKTGSSAIQAFLHRNADGLRRQGFSYTPTIPEWPDHNALAHAFAHGRDPQHGIALLQEQMKQAGDSTLLISSEMLIEPGTDSRRFLDVLDDGWQKTVIAYLRHPCDLLIAAFGEVTKHYESRYTRGINEFPPAYDPGQFDVLGRWLQYDDVHLILAPYDRDQWQGGSLFADFLSIIGANAEGLDLADIRANKSLSYSASEQLRAAVLDGISRTDHDALREQLMRNDRNDGRYPLDLATIQYCFERMSGSVPAFRPYLRDGFDVGYLFDSRWPD